MQTFPILPAPVPVTDFNLFPSLSAMPAGELQHPETFGKHWEAPAGFVPPPDWTEEVVNGIDSYVYTAWVGPIPGSLQRVSVPKSLLYQTNIGPLVHTPAFPVPLDMSRWDPVNYQLVLGDGGPMASTANVQDLRAALSVEELAQQIAVLAQQIVTLTAA
jgi:hypothetical protein